MKALLFPFGMLAAVFGMVLNVRYLNALLAADLNAEGQRRLEGVPREAVALINSGEPAVRVLNMLFTREYARFGDAELTRVGDVARRAMAICLPLVVGAILFG